MSVLTGATFPIPSGAAPWLTPAAVSCSKRECGQEEEKRPHSRLEPGRRGSKGPAKHQKGPCAGSLAASNRALPAFCASFPPANPERGLALLPSHLPGDLHEAALQLLPVPTAGEVPPPDTEQPQPTATIASPAPVDPL